MAHSCCCTNQCRACGQCCQVACGHRHAAHAGWAVGTGHVGRAPSPPAVTPEDVRRIIREELDRGPR